MQLLKLNFLFPFLPLNATWTLCSGIKYFNFILSLTSFWDNWDKKETEWQRSETTNPVRQARQTHQRGTSDHLATWEFDTSICASIPTTLDLTQPLPPSWRQFPFLHTGQGSSLSIPLPRRAFPSLRLALAYTQLRSLLPPPPRPQAPPRPSGLWWDGMLEAVLTVPPTISLRWHHAIVTSHQSSFCLAPARVWLCIPSDQLWLFLSLTLCLSGHLTHLSRLRHMCSLRQVEKKYKTRK